MNKKRIKEEKLTGKFDWLGRIKEHLFLKIRKSESSSFVYIEMEKKNEHPIKLVEFHKNLIEMK